MSIGIHWFRRDLRLTDNTALNRAVAERDQVVPVFIPSKWQKEHHWCGYPRQAFLCGSLEELDRGLRKIGGRLVVRSGDAVAVLEKLAQETGAEAIYFNRDPDPHGREVEARLQKVSEKRGIKLIACKDHALHEREEVLTGDGKPYKVFTPYARAWSKHAKVAPGGVVTRIHIPRQIPSEELPSPAHWGLRGDTGILKPGESTARARLAAFLDGSILHYGAARDLMAENGTSRLSQDLRHGLLSIREVYAACREAERASRSQAAKQSIATFINELIWREFYFQVLWHWPDVLDHEFQPEYRRLHWRGHWRPEEESAWERDKPAAADFERWKTGQTGFPIIDAAMRQLLATGFMHNRARMIVAMFLTKDLHLWWMHGESWFMRQLVDGEIASNNGGWQWSASTGTDAAPYFRIQNPWSQSKRFDPDGEYIKRWVPELRDVHASKFSRPPEGGVLAKGYPAPMVDHAEARERTLESFKKCKTLSTKH